jgi:exodeoxyribonuclease VII large subunit
MQTLFDDLLPEVPKETTGKKTMRRKKGGAVPLEPPADENAPKEPLSVSHFIAALNIVLGGFRARVSGEVTSAKRGPTGHWYFNLKDPEDGAMLNCVIWRTNYALSGIELEDGLAVIVSGVPDVYAPNGRLSFKADTIELVGEGALRAAYIKLKEKLAREGLFDESRKQQLPAFPQRIGIITSTKSGTVIHDFTNNLGRHGFKLAVCDARVEGAEAVRDLLGAIRSLKRRNLDVLVIIRGGGSYESLAPFDNEAVVREIAAFRVPVIAGIGHHEDVTLATLVADYGVSTPTAAANLLNHAWDEARHTVVHVEHTLMTTFSALLRSAELTSRRVSDVLRGAYSKIEARMLRLERRIFEARAALERDIALAQIGLRDTFGSILHAFPQACREYTTALATTTTVLKNKFIFAQEATKKELVALEHSIALNDPTRQLRLGWSITQRDGKIVRSVRDAPIGATIEVQVADGSLISSVEDVHAG